MDEGNAMKARKEEDQKNKEIHPGQDGWGNSIQNSV
jgi:hypothetical protein